MMMKKLLFCLRIFIGNEDVTVTDQVFLGLGDQVMVLITHKSRDCDDRAISHSISSKLTVMKVKISFILISFLVNLMQKNHPRVEY